MTYFGEGSARCFSAEDAHKRIHKGEIMVWHATMFTKHKDQNFVDDAKRSWLSKNCFSLCSCYLSLREKNHFIIEAYSPHRFSHQ